MTKLYDFVIPDDLLDAVEAETANPYLTDPAAGMQLIARLLAAPGAAPAAGEAVARLRRLIHEEFAEIVPFCGPSGAWVARDLAAIGASIEELALFPDLGNKVVVGIGGGFSAGKSRFLNTLLGIGLLPEGLGPTTAIPTCLAGGGSAVRAQNLMNSMVPVNAQELQALAHGFDRQFRQDGAGQGIGLAQLIKLLVIQDPCVRWKNLALLDTPGYNKPGGEPDAFTDEAIARQQLSQADHVVWLVNAKNGGLRLDDIRFLRSVDHRRPVFFVVTQADLQSASALPGIMLKVEEAASAAGIACAGVMGWSAALGQQHGKREAGADIVRWLGELDLQPSLTDKRRSAARLMDELNDYLTAQHAAGREELASLNAFWLVADQLSTEAAGGIRRLLAARRDSQRQYTDRIERLGEFARELNGALGAALDACCLADADSEDAVESQYQEAMLVLRSSGSPQRHADAFSLLYDAACHEHAHAQHAVAECYRLGTGTARDTGLAFHWSRKAAEQGIAEAQYMLGEHYLAGDGVARDVQGALQWYRAAAEQDHLRAQMKLYACYSGELEELVDLPVAIGWLKRAAQQELADAQYELGDCYLMGKGVAINRRTAFDWYSKAAHQGHARAQYAVGLAHLVGSAGADDDAIAVDWLRQAAQQHLPEAQMALGECYLEGRGVPVNRGHAASWYRKAERLGHVPAITKLGHCHFAADEPEEGARCYRRAAELGDAEAQYELGECYLEGNGVRKNRNLAKHWFELAEEQGFSPAREAIDEEFS